MDDKLKEIAAAAAREELAALPVDQGPQHVMPDSVPMDFEVGIVPAQRTNQETGEVSNALLVHLIAFSPTGQFHMVLQHELAGQLGTQLTEMSVMAAAQEKGLIVPPGGIITP